MKKLSEVLTTTKPIAEQSDRSNDISNMQVHGSITEAGKMNIQSQSKQEGNQKANPKEQEKQPYEVLCLKDDIEGQKKLTVLLADCFDALNLYGKEPEQLESMIRIFKLVLGRFTWGVIEKAFSIFLNDADKMPTPADIVKIIEPPKQERKWCGATYIQLCQRKRENQFMLDRELQYIADFEKARTTAPEDQQELIDDAIRQVEQQDKQYWVEI